MADTPYIKPTWLAEGEEKRTRVKEMFGQMAGRYDLLNSLMSLWMHGRWRKVAVEKL
jgi:ubiquinone/menaquinone biosynthesis C-methylase UbiE